MRSKPVLPARAAALSAALALLCSPALAGDMTWSGLVDGTVIVFIRGDKARVQKIDGKGPARTRAKFSGRLPSEAQWVFVIEKEGRGKVTLLQQPGAENDYTAAIRIEDPASGSGKYRVRVGWDKPWKP